MSIICTSAAIHSPYLPPLCATSATASYSDQAANLRFRNNLKWRHSHLPFSTVMRWDTLRGVRGNSVRQDRGSQLSNLAESFGKGFLGFSMTAAVVLSLTCDSPALAESLTVAFPASRAREVNTVQRTLVEAWGLIRDTFVDPTFNNQDWDSKLQQTMVEIFPLRSADAAYNKISGMLSTLDDPFTRIISPKVLRLLFSVYQLC